MRLKGVFDRQRVQVELLLKSPQLPFGRVDDTDPDEFAVIYACAAPPSEINRLHPFATAVLEGRDNCSIAALLMQMHRLSHPVAHGHFLISKLGLSNVRFLGRKRTPS